MLEAVELIEKAKNQRSRGRYEEALISSLGAVSSEPKSKEGWWQVSLNYVSLGNNQSAISALEKTIELWPEADGAWAVLGSTLAKVGDEEGAKEAFYNSLYMNQWQVEALRGLAFILSKENIKEQDEEEISLLRKIDEKVGLNYNQLNRIGVLYYKNSRLHEAEKYWSRGVKNLSQPSILYNLGLAYSNKLLFRNLDALDAWRLVLKIFPNYEVARKALGKLSGSLKELAEKVKNESVSNVLECQNYSNYINPFELLDYPDDFVLKEFSNKQNLKLKKRLMQEIELEEGKVEWLEGACIEKAKAIEVCDEVNNEKERYYHWLVYNDKELLEFLNKGSVDVFLFNEECSHLNVVEAAYRDEGFLEWLGSVLAPQYDKVLSGAIKNKKYGTIESLVSRRGWVPSSNIDRCFENSKRTFNTLIQPLLEAENAAKKDRKAIEKVGDVLISSGCIKILNLLPLYFEEHQKRVVSALRNMAISAIGDHDDTGLALKVLSYTKEFSFIPFDMSRQVEEDFEQLAKIIAREREHEVRLVTAGGEKWEITKSEVVKGTTIIKTSEVLSVRWGAVLSGNQSSPEYDYLMVIKATKQRQIIFAWKALSSNKKGRDFERLLAASKAEDNKKRSQNDFEKLTNAAINYILPRVIDRVENEILSETVMVGPCRVNAEGVEFNVKGWIFSKPHAVPWQQVNIDISNGEMQVIDSRDPKKNVRFNARDVDNAIVLNVLSNIKKVG